MELNCYGLTDIGKKRTANEDSFALINIKGNELTLAVVCDGMGGAKGGKTASSVCAKLFCEYVEDNISKVNPGEYPSLMVKASEYANTEIYSMSKASKELSGMGTTVVACLCDGEKYYCLSVGDSRVYAISDNGIVRISHDHSFVQGLVDSGKITEEEALRHPNRNIITKAVGIADELDPDVFDLDCKGISGILLCSDGLCGYVDESMIAEVCLGETNAKKCAEKLIELSNSKGGSDNITVVILRNN